MKICKNCIYWERFDKQKTAGTCKFNSYEKNIKGGKGKNKIALITFCGEQFGCIHFKEIENE